MHHSLNQTNAALLNTLAPYLHHITSVYFHVNKTQPYTSTRDNIRQNTQCITIALINRNHACYG